MSVIAKNPILPGFYPDPSVCAVGGDYYIVNSSFAYFPGLPVMHSRDLAHWEQIGNVLTTPEQLPLKGAEVSQGLFAPTIRYYNGTFYVICTNVTCGGNFIVTATDPAGPWSEMHCLEGADGIDPSLMFDNDGKCYYIGTHPNPEGCQYDGDWYIYVQELDIGNFKLVGEKKNVWNGAMKGIHWPEGPHLYHIGEYYYILHAEGGTGPEHAVCVARSKSPFGPFENNFKNPIITHRHMGSHYPVRYVGHGDIFQTVTGDWYMVMLAVRQLNGYTTLGRETFLARVIWEEGWPVVNPNMGRLSDELIIKLPEYEPEFAQNALPGVDKEYEFGNYKKLGSEWLMLRNPAEDMLVMQTTEEYKTNTKDGQTAKFMPGLNLKCGGDVTGKENVSYVGLRQDCHGFEAVTTIYMDNLCTGAYAGLMLMQNNRFHLRIEVSNWIGYVIVCRNGVEEKIARVRLNTSYALLGITVYGLTATVSVRKGEDKEPEIIASNIDISPLSTEVAGGFVGCTVGMYAQCDSNLEEPVYAAFRTFSYTRIKPVVQ